MEGLVDLIFLGLFRFVVMMVCVVVNVNYHLLVQKPNFRFDIYGGHVYAWLLN